MTINLIEDELNFLYQSLPHAHAACDSIGADTKDIRGEKWLLIIIHRTEFPFSFTGGALQKKAWHDPFCFEDASIEKALLSCAQQQGPRIIFWPANANTER
jgi:hypothetical protein